MVNRLRKRRGGIRQRGLEAIWLSGKEKDKRAIKWPCVTGKEFFEGKSGEIRGGEILPRFKEFYSSRPGGRKWEGRKERASKE